MFENGFIKLDDLNVIWIIDIETDISGSARTDYLGISTGIENIARDVLAEWCIDIESTVPSGIFFDISIYQLSSCIIIIRISGRIGSIERGDRTIIVGIIVTIYPGVIDRGYE